MRPTHLALNHPSAIAATAQRCKPEIERCVCARDCGLSSEASLRAWTRDCGGFVNNCGIGSLLVLTGTIVLVLLVLTRTIVLVGVRDCGVMARTSVYIVVRDCGCVPYRAIRFPP